MYFNKKIDSLCLISDIPVLQKVLITITLTIPVLLNINDINEPTIEVQIHAALIIM